MAGPVAHFDKIVGARVSRTIKGDEATRIAFVTGLDSTVIDADQILFEAMNAANVPIVGIDTYPNRPDLVCTRIDPESLPDDNENVKLTITYGIPIFDPTSQEPDTGEPQITGGVTVQSMTTSKDINGNPIFLHHEWDKWDSDGNIVFEELEEGEMGPPPPKRVKRDLLAKIEVLRPMYTFGLQRIESESPAAKALTYVGTTNGLTWFGFPSATILCTGITFASRDGGETFTVTYSFQYNPETWFADVAMTDSTTGDLARELPSEATPLVDPRTGDLNTPTGRMLVQVYRRRKFQNLRLLRDEGGHVPPVRLP